MAGWKYGKFKEIDVTAIENDAAQVGKRLYKLSKEVKQWKVLDTLREKVEGMKKLMPLIMDLRNPAMRDRHWKGLMEEVGQPFDPHGDDFTLEVVLQLGLENHSEAISGLSQAAGKELAIEDALVKIEAQWETLPLDMAEYKGDYLKLRSVDDLYSALEDNSVLVDDEGVALRRCLPRVARPLGEGAVAISETVEMLMGVQRKWMYLESIFVGSEDIRKQLPTESDSFDRVNDAWNTCTNDLKEAVTAYKGTHLDGMLDNLNTMDEQLDAIQKSLDEYLETKRQAFPRFYFLSNDDLLEILGQARDPMAVQPHVRKSSRRSNPSR